VKFLRLRADFAKGTFELADRSADPRETDDLELIGAFIADNPGASQRQVCKAVQRNGISRQRASDLLKGETGALWRVESGGRGSIRYFPASPSVPSVTAYKAAEHWNTNAPADP